MAMMSVPHVTLMSARLERLSSMKRIVFLHYCGTAGYVSAGRPVLNDAALREHVSN